MGVWRCGGVGVWKLRVWKYGSEGGRDSFIPPTPSPLYSHTPTLPHSHTPTLPYLFRWFNNIRYLEFSLQNILLSFGNFIFYFLRDYFLQFMVRGNIHSTFL